jgi:DNA-directed RNA polymerase subunit RPC12/RpoP
MAGPVPDAGEQVACPSCNEMVLQKAMIPIFQHGTKSYVCVACARRLIQPDAVAGSEGDSEAEPEDEAEATAAAT